MDENDEIWFGADGSQIPSRKSFLSEVKDGVSPVTIWPYKEVGHNHEANSEIKDLGLGGLFDNPKPTRLISRQLLLATNPDDIVLDFFAGSCTTAHAVLQLNAEDGGNRRHIMVQLPEPCDEKSEAFKAGYQTIAEIGKKRIRRAGRKIKDEHATTAPDLDIGFRVLKVGSSNMQDVYYAPDEVKQERLLDLADNIKPDRTPEDLLFQVLLDWGVDLALPISKEAFEMGKKDKGGKYEVFFVDENALAACFEEGVSEALVKKIAERAPLRAVFRDSGFQDDSMKINVEQIFKQLSPNTEVKVL